MAYDYQGAIKAGANPDDVLNYMASQTGYKAQEAVKAGANRDDVLKYMANIVPKKAVPVDTSRMERYRIMEQTKEQPKKTLGQKLSGIVSTLQNPVGKAIESVYGGEREYLDVNTGKYVPTSESTLKQRATGLVETFVDPVARFILSGVRAPQDIGALLADKEVSQYEAPLPSGRVGGTIQAGAKQVTEDVMSGKTSPLSGTLGLVGETVEGAGGVLGAKDILKYGIKTGTSLASKVAPKLATEAIPKQSLMQRAKDFLTSKLVGKTSDEILKIPEAQVGKLSVGEQKIWYQNKAQLASSEAEKATIAAKEAGQKSIEQSKQKINEFQQQLGNVSREKAIELKKPSQELIKNSSNQYIELSGEAAEASPALTKKVNMDELVNAIDNRFDDVPETKEFLKKFLGIDDKAKSELLSSQTITNQTILDKARELMASVSRTSKAGGRAYSRAEYEAVKQYQFLMEQLNKNGVDMTAANKFWREWVPVRDRIFKEIKPFDETNVGKIPFSTTLQRAEQTTTTGQKAVVKLEAQKFITELETRLNLPKGSISAEVKAAISNIEKAKLSKEVEKKAIDEITKQIKQDKIDSLNRMSLKQYDTERKAKIDKIIKRVLVGLGVIGAAKATGLDRTVLNVAGAVR